MRTTTRFSEGWRNRSRLRSPFMPPSRRPDLSLAIFFHHHLIFPPFNPALYHKPNIPAISNLSPRRKKDPAWTPRRGPSTISTPKVDDALEVEVQVIISETGRLFALRREPSTCNKYPGVSLFDLSSLAFSFISSNNLQPILTETHITLPTTFSTTTRVSRIQRGCAGQRGLDGWGRGEDFHVYGSAISCIFGCGETFEIT
jgi:hypothetical protein